MKPGLKYAPLTACFLSLFPALSATAENALSPAGDCAAFWLGYADYAHQSAYLDSAAEAAARQDAHRFRAVAIRLNGGDRASVDAHIAAHRHAMALMAEAFIYGGDKASQKIFERMAETCTLLAIGQPEFNKDQ